MVNELYVLKALKKVIEEQLNDYTTFPEEISSKNVLIEFPSTDLMPCKSMIYIQPNYAEFDGLSTESDSSVFNVAVFILCKKDNTENLTEKAFDFYNSTYKLMRTNMTLDGEVDFVDIKSFDYYPSVEANKNIVGLEIALEVRYSKEW